MEWKELRAALRGLTVYREELETEIGRSVTGLLDALHRQDGEEALAAYTGLFAALCREEFQGLGDWLWDRLRFHESAYSLLIDQGGSDPVLEQAARQDVDTLAPAESPSSISPTAVIPELWKRPAPSPPPLWLWWKEFTPCARSSSPCTRSSASSLPPGQFVRPACWTGAARTGWSASGLSGSHWRISIFRCFLFPAPVMCTWRPAQVRAGHRVPPRTEP